MKTIKIQVSSDTSADLALDCLMSRIPEESRNAPEFGLILPQVRCCIENFSAKARNLAKAGTTIHIEKEFTLPGASVLVVLDYPGKVGRMKRIAGILKEALIKPPVMR